MSYIFDVNEVPATGAESIFRLKSLFKTAGWNIVSSSDGSTLNSGDNITKATTGANGMANNYAWFFVQSPSPVTRSFIFQRGTNNVSWRLKYSPKVGFFTTVSQSATQTPSATDEVIVMGAGTDASPSFNATFFTTDNSYRFHACAGKAAENYTFYMFTNVFANTTPYNALVLDVMVSGSYPSEDPDPAVIYANQAGLTTMFASDLTSTGLKVSCFVSSSAPGQGYVPIFAQAIGSLFPGGIALNPYTNKDEYMPIPWARPIGNNPPNGWKGISTMMYWAGFYRQNLDLMTFNSVKDRIFIGNISLPWAGVDIAI